MSYIDQLEIEEVVYDIKDSDAVHTTELFDLVYPVGSYYFSANNTNPSLLFGGVWSQVQGGKFIIAADDGSYPAGSTGGSANAVVPAHTHSIAGNIDTAGAHTHKPNSTHRFSILSGQRSGEDIGSIGGQTHSISQIKINSGTWSDVAQTASAGAHTHTFNGEIGSTGVDGTGKNIPPYIAVNIWKRIS